MTLVVELDAETQARLEREAILRGVPPSDLARRLIQDNVPGVGNEVTVEELDAIADELAEMGSDLPVLPPDAYTRESFYEGRP